MPAGVQSVRVLNPVQECLADDATSRHSRPPLVVEKHWKDTNAVLSPTPRDLLLARIGAAYIGSTLCVALLVLAVLAVIVIFAGLGVRSGSDDNSDSTRWLIMMLDVFTCLLAHRLQ